MHEIFESQCAGFFHTKAPTPDDFAPLLPPPPNPSFGVNGAVCIVEQLGSHNRVFLRWFQQMSWVILL